MKLKNSLSFFIKSPFVGFRGLLFCFLFFTFSCEKEEKVPVGASKLVVGSTASGAISYTTVTVSTVIESIKGNKITNHGHCWGTTANPLVGGSKTALGSLSEAKTITSQLENLLPNTSYFIRAYLTTQYETIYGTETSFKTIDYAKPTVSTIVASGITPFLSVSGGNVTSDGGLTVTTRGVVWNTSNEPTITSKMGITADGAGIGSFTSQLNNLQPGTAYFVRAYATNGKDTGYGESMTFTTKSISAPEVTTTNVTGILTTSAISGGNVTNDGNLVVTARGVCWKLGPDPTINDFKTTDGTGAGSFTSTLTALQPNSDYYLRAYATNSQGTAYGAQMLFTTAKVLSLATVTTTAATSVTFSSAVLGGSVTSDGNASVTERGVCYSTSQNPTTSNSKLAIGSGTGSYSNTITGLTANTTYYVRAYANNSQGTAYGNELSFKTSLALSLAALTTATPVTITSNSATLGGNVTSDGNASVTERGVCYSTSTNPTTASNKADNGSGTGSFSGIVNGLISNTTYYIRAYAINSQGAAYGNEVSFKTSALYLATLTTNTPSNITANSATLGGNVTNDGDTPIIERGICYSTSSNPTTGNTKFAIGTGTGYFSNTITGLTANTTYYIRGYAINSLGTAYGNEISFKTSVVLALASLTTSNPLNITTSGATLGGNISSDGNATVTERGICYDTSPNPTTSSSNMATGSGIGAFSNSITGLISNTTYYVRAYAKNSQGTAYGNEINFKTNVVLSLATLSTSAATNISFSSTTLGGIVTNDGNSIVTERGICYSTSQNPTVNNVKLANNGGTGLFDMKVSGLITNMTYYVRAYAINTNGTAYGNEIIFKTSIVSIGDNYQGGIVAFVFQLGNPGYINGQTHGLIAAPYDQSTGIVWSVGNNSIGAIASDIGAGAANTNAIVSRQGEGNYAAKLCYDLVLDGYSDWYLPSIFELTTIYAKKATIGGFNTWAYWSSTEKDFSEAWLVLFGLDGSPISNSKGSAGSTGVRAIRSF